jgi:hypothetical protein
MSDTDTREVERLEICVDALNLGSPSRSQAPSPPPTVRKPISLKLKESPSHASPKTKSPKTKSPKTSLPQSKDVSSEASLPILEIDSAQEKITTAEPDSSVKPKWTIRMKKKRSDQLTKSAVVLSTATTGFNEPVPTEEESIIGHIIRSLFQDDEPSELPPQNQWVRPIDFEGQIRWVDYDKKFYFKRVAWIVPDLAVVEEASKSAKKGKGKSSKQPGDKRRQTLIQFVNTIPVDLWKEPVEWIYILVIDGFIVKIGGTRVGLDDRCRSYLSGHCVPEKGGKSVSTNAFIYHTFHWYLEQGMSIEMYGYRIEPKQDTDTMLGFTETYLISRYHVWEAKLLGEFERLYGKKPPLSSNSDPKYRK